MKKDTKVLGKGLSALLGEVADADSLRKPIGYVNKEVAGSGAPARMADVLMVPAEKIDVNPFQPRLDFDESKIEELAQSISTLGLIQPVTLRRIAGGRYQIISGERRFRACCKAGMKLVPSYVRDASDQGMLEMALVENIQRENLDPIEIAVSLRSLMEECNLTQEQVSERLGKKRASVANYLRLLRLPDKVQHDLREGLLSVGHAKVLLGIEDPAQQQMLCDLVVKDSLTVRELEEKVASATPRAYEDLAEKVQPFFNSKVSVRRNAAGKGSLTIRFDSDAEVEAFLKKIKK